MKNDPRVYVIIPIYNVQPYLRECILSIINQTYPTLRIILVNDGSTDESETIAKEYLYDQRITLISKENGGLSSARNEGLKLAFSEGEDDDYILFLDSDDYLELDYITLMIQSFRKHPDCVISFGGCTIFDESGLLGKSENKDENISYSGLYFLEQVPNHYFTFANGGGGGYY